MPGNIKLVVVLWIVSIGILVVIPYQVQSDIEEFVSPAAFPRLAILCVMGLSLILLFQKGSLKSDASCRTDGAETVAERDASVRVAVTFLCLICYLLLMMLIGYALATLICIGFYVRYLGEKRLKVSLPFASLTTVVLYLFFCKVLNVPLPGGILFG